MHLAFFRFRFRERKFLTPASVCSATLWRLTGTRRSTTISSKRTLSLAERTTAKPRATCPPSSMLPLRFKWRQTQTPFLQADGGKRVIIAATYRSWKEEGVNRLERDFVIDETGADELGEEGDLHDKDTDGRRRLSESALSATASGATFSSSSITSFSRPYTYTLEAQVGTGRYDGTRNEVTVKLFGSGGKESNFLNLGQGLKKGEKRIVEGEQPCPILSPSI